MGSAQDISSNAVNDPLANAGPGFYLYGSLSQDREGYLGELSSTGNQLLYGSFLSGYVDAPDSLSIANAIAVSPAGPVYVAGETVTSNFPVTDGGLRTGIGDEGSGFLVKFQASSIKPLRLESLATAQGRDCTVKRLLQLPTTGIWRDAALPVASRRLTLT
jgi:hypothetical protein